MSGDVPTQETLDLSAATAQSLPPSRASVWRRRAAFGVGVLLLVGAIAMVVRHPDELRRAMDAARGAAWWLVGLLVLLPALNWVCISGVFWVLTARRAPGRVPPGEMAALIGTAWLLNYIPLRPGLFGRVALHRRVHGIAVRESAWVLGENIAAGGVAIGLALLGIVCMRAVPATRAEWVIGAFLLGVPVLGTVVCTAVGGATARAWSCAVLLRAVDLSLWGVRYAVASAIAGRGLTAPEAIALAAVSQVAMLVPLAGNGLGLREWAIGVAAVSLPAAWSAQAQEMTSAAGLFIDLLNRAAEVVAALPIGLVCSGWLARRYARRHA
ncbi:MAG: hypothetical protein SFY96_12115 [Planctomycetota bacterium]|nr:hypothetical protein [Planctomycetota bacterium]